MLPLGVSWFSPLSSMASLVAQMVKNLPAIQNTWVRSLDWDYPLEKGMATHSSILAWRIHPMDRSLAGHSPWGCKESDTTERLYFHFSFNGSDRYQALSRVSQQLAGLWRRGEVSEMDWRVQRPLCEGLFMGLYLFFR